jgi:zinc protease
MRLAAFMFLSVYLVTRAAALAPAPKAPDLALEAYTLPNGLKVALHRDPIVPRVTVTVAYHVGSKNEKAGRTGFAHFFEHMMFRGTKNVPNYDIPLHEVGAESNAFTNQDMTVYFETVPTNFLERALYLEAERMAFLPSALDQHKFDTEREVVKNERRQSYENRPYGLDQEAITAALFPAGHPYSWSVIGSMDNLNKATLDDLKQFFAEFYHPANATLCLAGEFEPAAAKALIEKYFGPLRAGTPPAAVLVPDAPAKAAKLVRLDRVQLPRVYWNWPGVASDHPDAPALDLLTRVLAGGETSRLHRALVLEKRVSKDVSAVAGGWEASGRIGIQSTAAIAGSAEKSLAEIESVLESAVKAVQTSPPSDAELARALALYEKASFARLTSPLGRAVTLAVGFAQNSDARHYQKIFARYYQVTPADLSRVALKYLTPDKVVVWTESVKRGQTRSEAAKAGPSSSAASAAAPAVVRAPDGGLDWSKLPGPSAATPFKAPNFVRKTLSNGLDVWLAEWKTLPLVSVSLSLPAGTADDPDGKSGLASLAAALFDKGTKNITATELAESLETLGVRLGVGSSADTTDVDFDTISRNLEPALKQVTEVLSSPRFDPKDFSREQALALARLVEGPDNVSWLAGRAFPVLLYGKGHPYANPSDGYSATVKALTLEDVKAFHSERLGPRGATLVVVGDVDSSALFALLESTLGTWKANNAKPASRTTTAAAAEPGLIYFVDKPGAVQSVLNVGRRWVDRADPSYYATLLGNRILGGDFLSRLNQNLREKNGYTYGARSSFRFRRTGSTWSVSTAVRADATAPALKEALGELDGLLHDKPLKPDEITTALDALVRSYPSTFQSPGSIAGILSEMAEFHLPAEYLDTFVSALRSTSADGIGKAMAEVVAPAERVILIVGDRKVVAPKLTELGFSKIRPITYDGQDVQE